MNSPFNVRFEVLTAVLMKIQDLWDVTTVESRSIVPVMIVFPHVLFAIFGPELSSI